MNAEKAINKWAGGRLGIDPDSILTVEFGTKEEGGCPTCEYTLTGVEVSYKQKDRVKYGFVSLGYESFSTVLKEILEEGMI